MGGKIRQKALGKVAGAFASVHPLTAVPGGRGRGVVGEGARRGEAALIIWAALQ